MQRTARAAGGTSGSPPCYRRDHGRDGASRRATRVGGADARLMARAPVAHDGAGSSRPRLGCRLAGAGIFRPTGRAPGATRSLFWPFAADLIRPGPAQEGSIACFGSGGRRGQCPDRADRLKQPRRQPLDRAAVHATERCQGGGRCGVASRHCRPSQWAQARRAGMTGGGEGR
jgi:hypothetical protein